ncbi:MAG: bifunctional adenosylcobinamide kinase/adenosylcobinamide-phosphate guanylyltransferase [Clostridiales Family XIII bacterium]|jgi:adenosylcobinamide kinase/adenosylcobinamide-phosphate guanylyltransferase|nr:bifunctional adenosylcobinamide kinase/adenosylcobinamide-phosphate guanylyltransferase [Clostridiales Family XIII bacterium]
MSDIWLITGGGRSGKSAYAEALATEKGAATDVAETSMAAAIGPGIRAENTKGSKAANSEIPMDMIGPGIRAASAKGSIGAAGGGKAGSATVCHAGVLYIATAACVGDEMRERVARHRADRPKDWITWERCRGLADIGTDFDASAFGTILLDCVGNLLMGILFEEIPDEEDFQSDAFARVEQLSVSEIDTLCAYARKHEKRLIFVTNEIGMGIIPATRYSRYYRDAIGRINKHAAAAADRAVLMVSGIPLVLK